MPTFAFLFRWTDQGVRAVRKTTERYRAGVSTMEKMGIEMKNFVWTTGSYDAIAIFDAPDQETASAAALKFASKGNVRLETLRAYSADEMDEVLQKIA